MINRKTAVTLVEQLDSFIPILYETGGRTLLFAKQNGRLFRVLCHPKNPLFFVVFPDRIERMTWQDVKNISKNAAGRPSTRFWAQQLSRLFQTFSNNMAGVELKMSPGLYENSCSMVVAADDFKGYLENLSQPIVVQRENRFAQAIMPVVKPAPAPVVKPAPAPVVSVAPAPVVETKPILIEKEAKTEPLSVLEMDDIQIVDTDLSLPADKVFQVNQDIVDFYGVSDNRPNFNAFYEICKMKRALQLGIRDIYDSRCHDFEFAPRWFNNQEIIFKTGEACVHISIDKKAVSFITLKQRNVGN